MTARDVVFEAMQAGALTARDVARVTGVNHSTVKACISGLLAMGWVRAVSRSAHNTYTYAVTDKGLMWADPVATEPDADDDLDDDMPIRRLAPADLVESAMRSRTPLELAWVGAA